MSHDSSSKIAGGIRAFEVVPKQFRCSITITDTRFYYCCCYYYYYYYNNYYNYNYYYHYNYYNNYYYN
eukprot:gene4583-biopygen5354